MLEIFSGPWSKTFSVLQQEIHYEPQIKTAGDSPHLSSYWINFWRASILQLCACTGTRTRRAEGGEQEAQAHHGEAQDAHSQDSGTLKYVSAPQ